MALVLCGFLRIVRSSAAFAVACSGMAKILRRDKINYKLLSLDYYIFLIVSKVYSMRFYKFD